MDLVSAFRPDDIDEERRRTACSRWPRSSPRPRSAPRPTTTAKHAASMLGDFAARLAQRGIRVSVGHRGRLALAAAHAGKAVVVETDEAFMGLSLRESLRLRPDVLRRLGWHYLRVHSFERFGNPEAVANRVGTLLGKPEARPADAAAS